MATAKLTPAMVAKTEPGDKEILIWDSIATGLGLRVLPSGSRSFIMKYRVGRGRGAPVRKVTFGPTRDMTLAEARAMAEKWRAAGRDGRDLAREAEKRTNAPKVSDLAKTWLDDVRDHKRTWLEDQQKIDKHILPAIGKLRVAEVTRDDIRKLHRGMRPTPYAANRTLALVSSMFNLAIKDGLRGDNPAKGIRRYQEDRRERYLTPEELARLTAALAKHDDQRRRNDPRVADAIRLLILTGARRGEVLSARWEQFDLEAGVWTKPSSHTKTKKAHRVPLSPPALEILARLAKQKSGCGYVFPGRVYGQPLTDIKNSWSAICKAADIDARLHDLRHTYASFLVSGGASLEMIGRLLGHTQPGTTARYAHLFDDPLREATGRVGSLVKALEAGNEADVEPLRPGGKAS